MIRKKFSVRLGLWVVTILVLVGVIVYGFWSTTSPKLLLGTWGGVNGYDETIVFSADNTLSWDNEDGPLSGTYELIDDDYGNYIVIRLKDALLFPVIPCSYEVSAYTLVLGGELCDSDTYIRVSEPPFAARIYSEAKFKFFKLLRAKYPEKRNELDRLYFQ